MIAHSCARSGRRGGAVSAQNPVGGRTGIAYAVGSPQAFVRTRGAQSREEAGLKQTYRVTAFYERPELERNAIVQAESPEQAMVRALLERKVPVGFARDEYGWIQPVFWKAELGGGRRWPRVVSRDTVAWGDDDDPHTLRFAVEED
jgi:hypothetical protein